MEWEKWTRPGRAAFLLDQEKFDGQECPPHTVGDRNFMKNRGMKIKHPKLRGEWAELRFMTRAAEHGLCVTKPWGETARYDLRWSMKGTLCGCR